MTHRSDDPRWWIRTPVISRRSDGDQLIGERGPSAEALYAAGTPPMHGLSARHLIDVDRVARVRIGDRLPVEQRGDGWVLLSEDGALLGRLRWAPSDDGRVDKRTGGTIRLPARGMLHVERAVLTERGVITDVAGTVHPADGDR